MLKDEKDRFYETMYISLDANMKTQTIKRYMRPHSIKEATDKILTNIFRPFMTTYQFHDKLLNIVMKQWVIK